MKRKGEKRRARFAEAERRESRDRWCGEKQDRNWGKHFNGKRTNSVKKFPREKHTDFKRNHNNWYSTYRHGCVWSCILAASSQGASSRNLASAFFLISAQSMIIHKHFYLDTNKQLPDLSLPCFGKQKTITRASLPTFSPFSTALALLNPRGGINTRRPKPRCFRSPSKTNYSKTLLPLLPLSLVAQICHIKVKGEKLTLGH